MTDVFISYSRRDKSFVQVLHQALKESKYETWVDWQNIPPTAEWWKEIEAGIEAADTFIFVLSPDSVSSQVCSEEVDRAMANNKRLIPVVRRDIDDSVTIHPALSRHNWLFFRETDDFQTAFQELVKTLNTDLDHVKQHTWLLVRAKEWSNKDNSESLLLRGNELQQCETWLSKSAEKTPKPTQLQHDYVSSSRSAQDATVQATQILKAAAEKGNRRVLIGTIAMMAGLIVAGITGSFAYNAKLEANASKQESVEAKQQVTDAEKKVQQAEQEITLATQELEHAEQNLITAQEKEFDAVARIEETRQQLNEAQQQLIVAQEQSQIASTQAEQAQQAEAEAHSQVEVAHSQLEQASQEVAQRTQELQQLEQNLIDVEVAVRRAEGQFQAMRSELGATIGDALSRVERQTGQRSAVIYVSFTHANNADENGAASPSSEEVISTPSRSRSNLENLLEQQFIERYNRNFDKENYIESLSEDKSENSDNQIANSNESINSELALWFVTTTEAELIPVTVTKSEILQVRNQLLQSVSNPIRGHQVDRFGQRIYEWLIKPLEDNHLLDEQTIDTLLFLMHEDIRTIPLATLYDGENYLIEKYSLGVMPGLTLTDTDYIDLKNAHVLAAGASEFNDSQLNPLPGVELELSEISDIYSSKILLNDDFTLENLEIQRQQDHFQILHIATQAEFDVEFSENSFIALQNGTVRLPELAQQDWYSPPVELLVISGCRGALGNEEYRFGFASAALQAGVKSVLASTNYISDDGTVFLMQNFYEQLRIVPTKAEALRQAQLAMLNSDDYYSPFYWATFRIIGNPW